MMSAATAALNSVTSLARVYFVRPLKATFLERLQGGADFTLRNRFGDTIAERDVTTWINRRVHGEFIGRFAFGRFQPCGGGVGIYYAESAGSRLGSR
jgi:hypothetical protein